MTLCTHLLDDSSDGVQQEKGESERKNGGGRNMDSENRTRTINLLHTKKEGVDSRLKKNERKERASQRKEAKSEQEAKKAGAGRENVR